MNHPNTTDRSGFDKPALILTDERIEHATVHLRTVRDLIRVGVTLMSQAKVVFGQGTDHAWDEATYLTLHTLGLPIDQLDPFLDAIVLPHERIDVLNQFAKRINERMPAAYITGQAWLQGYPFKVTPDVIIPRSPIAEILTSQLDTWVAEPHATQNVLDICTGSGCLAILAALMMPQAQVDATDLSPQALAVAQHNIDHYALSSRVSLYQGHLLEALPANKRYEVIVCNPPYVNQTSIDRLPQEFRYEPLMALAGGSDGMDLVREILQQCAKRLTPDGVLILEIGHEQAHFEAAFGDLSPIWIDTLATHHHVMALSAAQLQS